MLNIILITLTGLVLFFYLSIGLYIPIEINSNLDDNQKMKWYKLISLCLMYAFFWIPIFIAAKIVSKYGRV